MSALQLAWIWAAADNPDQWRNREEAGCSGAVKGGADEAEGSDPPLGLAFYRKHTEGILRRYLYASMQIGRAPSILADPIGRGWVSSRPVRTFEDAVIFVLDVEKCLERLNSIDKALLSRIVLQEYTQAEAAALLGISPRAVCYKLPRALDRLTERLLEVGVLVIPES